MVLPPCGETREVPGFFGALWRLLGSHRGWDVCGRIEGHPDRHDCIDRKTNRWANRMWS